MQKNWQSWIQSTIEKSNLGSLVYSYEVARSSAFALQSLTLPLWSKLAGYQQSSPEFSEFFENYKLAFSDLLELLRQDADRIEKGIYPWTVLKPRLNSSPFWMYSKVIRDGFRVARRRQSKESQDFKAESKDYFQDLPSYYRRNFHFQTEGYLSPESADLYEYQVEILFSGAADAMRRLLLAPLKKKFGETQGEGLRFLEVGCGTGRLSHFVKQMYPKARITLLDLSDPYLKRAQKELESWNRLDFVQGDAAELPFKDQSFDAVFSCFLFHELPKRERLRVLKEGRRVLKPKGFYGLVDSIQLHEKPHLNWALERFPVDFHEPFYTNYIQTPMQALVKEAGFLRAKVELGFFSKAVWAESPSES